MYKRFTTFCAFQPFVFFILTPILQALQKLDKKVLLNIGLTEDNISSLYDKGRPPIPEPTVIQLLSESKFVCCICRNKTSGVVIHHIEEWHISHSHDEKNLVVLCPNHHSEAHTKRGLALNLTPERLIALKEKWKLEIQEMDRQVVLNIVTHPDANWDYFNHGRIFDLYFRYKISNKGFQTTSYLKEQGLIDSLGTFAIVDNPEQTQFYKFHYCYLLRYYMGDILSSLLGKIPFIDITDKFTKQKIKSVSAGDYIALQAGFYFKQLTKNHKGINQTRKGYYKKGGLLIEFIFNPYECTSDSSNFVHVTGHTNATIIGQVRSIIKKDSVIEVSVSCLAIGCFMNKHPFWIEKEKDLNSIFNNEEYVD